MCPALGGRSRPDWPSEGHTYGHCIAHATPQSLSQEAGSLQLVAAMLQLPCSARGSWRMSVSSRRERALCPQQPGLKLHSGYWWVRPGPDSAPRPHPDLAPPPLIRSDAQLRSLQGPGTAAQRQVWPEHRPDSPGRVGAPGADMQMHKKASPAGKGTQPFHDVSHS